MQYKTKTNKRKIINDPVYGFIAITTDLMFDLIEHPYFQRLRRIKQLGLTYLVYPGAIHSRFQHSLGATHLMKLAIESLRYKNQTITTEEAKAVTYAILLHDIGHGPFSHTLEKAFVSKISHEQLTVLFMQYLNRQKQNKLEMALAVFQNQYPKKFLHQLVSSQLDMDRLDYLMRDSFFSGVTEGVVNSDRIIKMLNVSNDELVIEQKGIYSVEKFLIARRLMYWQVYLHKTVTAAEQMLMQLLKRARQLAMDNVELFATPALHFFLHNTIDNISYFQEPQYINGKKYKLLDLFARLDDNDLTTAIKLWADHSDPVLSSIAYRIINRQLFRIEIYTSKKEIDTARVQELRKQCQHIFKLSEEESGYFVFSGILTNNAYRITSDNINILMQDKTLLDIAQASDISNVSALSKTVKKYFLCFPKELHQK